MLELFLLLVQMPKNWKPDVRESVYQVLRDQLYIQPEDMNDDLNFEEALQNGPGDRDLMLRLYTADFIFIYTKLMGKWEIRELLQLDN